MLTVHAHCGAHSCVATLSEVRVFYHCNIPMDVFESFLHADSHGRYFDNFIKDRFEHKKEIR